MAAIWNAPVDYNSVRGLDLSASCSDFRRTADIGLFQTSSAFSLGIGVTSQEKIWGTL